MMLLAIAVIFVVFGLLILLVAGLVTSSQRKNRRQLRRLNDEVERLTRQLQTPEERAAAARRIEAIEAEKREIHGRFDSGGC